jgi:uncharacterized protein YcsI (UPF0317 family)
VDLGPALAVDSDVRTDIPLYRVYRDGKADAVDVERIDAPGLWRDDLVTFLLGCSFSWEDVLDQAGLRPRQIAENCNVPMFRTNLRSNDAGPFGSELVVSMRPYRPDQLAAVQAITAQYPGAHGGPLHWGSPEAIGIDPASLGRPQWGDPVTVKDDEVPVFWACGVSSQVRMCVARRTRESSNQGADGQKRETTTALNRAGRVGVRGVRWGE